MPLPTLPASTSHWVDDLRQSPAKQRAVGDLYRSLDVEKSLAGDCQACGKCCGFATMGHRLFVTTLELAYFAAIAPPPADPSAVAAGRCPWQIGANCGAREARPLGCRVFFCATDDREGNERVYTRFHKRLQDLHGELGVEYAYGEWLSSLSAVLDLPFAPPWVISQQD